MYYLFVTLLPYEVVAGLIGGLVAYVTAGRPAPFTIPPLAGVIAFLAGTVVAMLGIVPGRAGLWLDTGLLLSLAYVIGSLSGGILHLLIHPARETAPHVAESYREGLPPMNEEVVKGVGGDVIEVTRGEDLARPAAEEATPVSEPGRPAGLAAARGGEPDDLTLVRGIDARIAGALSGLGIWHFDQIASWSPEEERWIGRKLGDPTCALRDKWVEQARTHAGGGTTEYAERALHGTTPWTESEQSRRPLGLAAPRAGGPDDLRLVSGIDPAMEAKLNEAGVFHYDQIAAMDEPELRWLSDFTGHPRVAMRERWVQECELLAAGGSPHNAREIEAPKTPSNEGDVVPGRAGGPGPGG